ncbi:MAG: selenocysteine-specific translation elongation factor [Thiobacillus sp.]|nr:selenocysteine-specific translation elongation factor [Thiobacillus sp.]
MLIGTAGHIDHGKTTLVKALTGVDADRLPEEKSRGITLDLGYAYSQLPDGSVLGFVDVPGHEKLIHNMLAGVTGIDFVLLVIAADDGPMLQTREHLELLDLLGLTRGAIALTKIDAVPPQRLDEARQEVEALIAGTGLSGSPVFPLSGRTGEGVAALRAHLEAAAASLDQRSAAGRFRLAIDRCFTLTGIGTVVTGTAHAGTIGVGLSVIISPPGLKARVRGLHVQDRPAESGQAGERIALALTGDFEKKDIARGMWVVDPVLAMPLNRFHGELRVPAGQKPLTHLQTVHVHLGTEDILGRVALLDCQEVEAGSTALVEILLERETLALRGDRFILRDAGAQRTVAGGRVLDIFPPIRHKRSPQRLALLDAMRNDDPAVTLGLLAEQATAGIDLDRFAVSWNLTGSAAESLWQRAGLRVIRDGNASLGFTTVAWTTLEAKLLDALGREHERAPDMIGVERERLRRMTAAHLPRPAFDALANQLLASGRIAQTRAWLHLPAHRASVTAADRELFAVLKPLLDAAPYNPPRVRDVFKAAGTPEDAVRQLFKRLARAGELYPVAHDHYYTSHAVAELAGFVRTLNDEHGAARIATLRDLISGGGGGGGGRKVATQILEFFDRVGYTRRVRDDHVLRHEGAMPDWTPS